jgi:hypothetical protein
VSRLLHEVPGLDEAAVGDYVGDGAPFCADVLK